MRKYPALAFFALLLASLAFGVKAIPQVAASEKIASYLGDYRDAVVPLDNTLESASERFWVFYAPLKSDKKILAAVSDFDGVIVTDKVKMSTIASLVYKKELIAYLEEGKLSVSDLDAFSENLESKVTNAKGIYSSSVAGVLESKYPAVDFASIGKKLDDLSFSAEEFSNWLEQGKELQNNFKGQPYTDLTINDFFNYYNKTMDKLSSLIDLVIGYKNALVLIFNKKEVSSDRTTLTGLDIDPNDEISSFRVLRFNPVRAGFLNYLAASDTWVNNSVEGFFYRQVKVDAQQEYDTIKQKAAAVLAAEYDFLNYAINLSNFNGVDIKKEWAGIGNIINSKTSTGDDYAVALQRMQALDKTLDAVKEKYAGYIIATPRPRQPAAQDYSGYTNAAIGVIIAAVVAYGVYSYYKKKSAGEEEEAGY
jgi:hypothetical protein